MKLSDIEEQFLMDDNTKQTKLFFESVLSRYLKRGDKVVDVGCGRAKIFWEILKIVGAEGEIIGADISPRTLEQNRAEFKVVPNIKFILESATNLSSVPSNYANMTLCLSTLFSLANAPVPIKDVEEVAIRELVRITAPGGFIAISFSNYNYLLALRDAIAYWEQEGIHVITGTVHYVKRATIGDSYVTVIKPPGLLVRQYKKEWIMNLLHKFGLREIALKEEYHKNEEVPSEFHEFPESLNKILSTPHSYSVLLQKPTS